MTLNFTISRISITKYLCYISTLTFHGLDIVRLFIYCECHLIKWNEPLNASYFRLSSYCTFLFVLIWNSFVGFIWFTVRCRISKLRNGCFLFEIYINYAKLCAQTTNIGNASCLHGELFWWLISHDSKIKRTTASFLRHTSRMFLML